MMSHVLLLLLPVLLLLCSQVSGQPQVQQEMFVTVSFTNPFNFPLHNVYLAMEGAGLMDQRTRFYRCTHL